MYDQGFGEQHQNSDLSTRTSFDNTSRYDAVSRAVILTPPSTELFIRYDLIALAVHWCSGVVLFPFSPQQH